MTRLFPLTALLAATVAAVYCSDGTGPGQGCVDENGAPLPISPAADRVDLDRPVFTNPTIVTNALNPISQLDRTILLGSDGGLPLRVETTLLPYTKTIEWNGQEITALASQFVSFLDGRILEVATDWYVQADDGAVWYLGEDVFNYENGVVLDTEGSWIAGEDGPGGMIMAANPQVGNVWRPENICGTVFEEVTVESTGVTVNGPRGPVSGAILVQELHQDAQLEPKYFAPGYGEFLSGSGADVEALALAVPIDALAGSTPPQLTTIARLTTVIFDAAAAGNWAVATAARDTIATAWTAYRAGGVPPLLDTQMIDALAGLTTAVNAAQAATARQASIDVARAGLDFQLRYRPRTDVDLDNLDLWVRQIIVDSEANDLAGVMGDIATLRWIRERFVQDVIEEPELDLLDAAARRRAWSDVDVVARRLRAALATVP